MPLSGIALCDAEIITPRSAPSASTRWATAGVGSTPDPHGVRAGGGEPGDHGRLEHLPAGARVAADHGDGPMGPVAFCEHARRRGGQRRGRAQE